MAERTSYTLAQIVLHWVIAVMILMAYVASDGMGRALQRRIEEGWTGITGNTVHVWLGAAVFFLILMRIVIRRRSGAPPPAPETKPWMAMAAHIGHMLLYLLMILVPVTGSAAWYGHMATLGDVHEILANALIILVIGHALAAIAHEIQTPGKALVRMLKAQK